MASPRISVVMSVYNGEQFLPFALDSILRQTYKDFEFIIVDDGSTDKTSYILKKTAEADPRVKIITQERRGLTRSLNRGLEIAGGEYVARMDADDISALNRLEKQLVFMDTHPDVVACGSPGLYINEAGETVGAKNLPTDSRDIKKKILWNNQCIHSSLFFRRLILTALDGYNESFVKSQDYELLLRLMQKYHVANLPDRLIFWRVRHGSVSWSGKSQEWDALRARWRAVFHFGYPKMLGLFIIFVRLLWFLVPQRVKFSRYAHQSHHSHS